MPDELRPTMGLRSATLLIVGSSIGSGIFLLPSSMARQVGSPWLLIGVWVLCGLLSLAGALTFAEMGAMFPRAGGQYVFLRQAFGDRAAFLYGWTFFWVIQTGIIAAVATAFSTFLSFLVPLSGFEIKLIAMGIIALLTLVNVLGVRYGAAVSDVFTGLKLLALAALIVLGFVLARASTSFAAPVVPKSTTGLVGAFGLAMAAAFFAYDGWNQSAFVAAEVKRPQRNVPLSMLIGVLVVMTVYVLANAVYAYVLPFDQMQATTTLAADTAEVLLGPVGATLITLAILVSVFGTVNAYVLSGPRVYYAMAKDGLSYRGMGNLSRRFATPDFALIIQAEWAMLLVLTGSYTDLVNFSVFAIWFFYGIAGVGLFVLRRKMPNAPRPYRTVLYPLVPMLFIATSVFIVTNTLVTDTRNALFGLLLILSGVPALIALEWWHRRTSPHDSATQATDESKDHLLAIDPDQRSEQPR
ncbi:MAG: amino acid permease [Candidatus Thermoplasmatota archaeon]